MAQAFQTTDEITSPWPSAVRTFASAAGAIGGALTRVLRRYPEARGRVSISRVSSRWLLEHEIRTSKRQGDA